MIEILIRVNGLNVRRWGVYNRGPVGGPDGKSFEKGDGPGGPGLRRYQWEVIRNADGLQLEMSGEVLHARSDPIEAIAARVLEDVAERVSMTSQRADTWNPTIPKDDHETLSY